MQGTNVPSRAYPGRGEREDVGLRLRHGRWSIVLVAVLAWASMSCTATSSSDDAGRSPSSTSGPEASPEPSRSPIDSREAVVRGTPIDVARLTGRIVLSSEDDV